MECSLTIVSMYVRYIQSKQSHNIIKELANGNIKNAQVCVGCSGGENTDLGTQLARHTY